MRRSTPPKTMLLALLAASAAGGDDTPTSPTYDPDLPTAWAEAVTNPYFPLVPGTVPEYRGETEDGTETIRVEVLHETRVVHARGPVLVQSFPSAFASAAPRPTRARRAPSGARIDRPRTAPA